MVRRELIFEVLMPKGIMEFTEFSIRSTELFAELAALALVQLATEALLYQVAQAVAKG